MQQYETSLVVGCTTANYDGSGDADDADDDDGTLSHRRRAADIGSCSPHH